MEKSTEIRIEESWRKILEDEFSKPHMVALKEFLKNEYRSGKKIFPPGKEIFSAFDLTPFPNVKVVILGQDPYHGEGQAHGLCFSVRKGVRPPPSLQNIFKELKDDLGMEIPNHGDLSEWAKQGVLLLNTVLSVEEGKAASHKGRGWEFFTDRVIQLLNNREDPIVFILWGSFAQGKANMIKSPPHAIIKSAHPSPLSAHNGFWKSKPFSRANEILRSWGKKEIDWRLNT